MAWAHQIWWREIENSRKVTVLLEAISLVPWISHFPTKNVLHDKNRTFSKRNFSAVGFRDFLKTLKTQRQNSLFLYKSAWFHWQSNAFSMVWFPNSWFYLISSKNCIVAMFSCFTKSEKNFLPREVYLLAWCPMLNWSRRRVYNCHKNMKSMGFFTVFRKFSRKNL